MPDARHAQASRPAPPASVAREAVAHARIGDLGPVAWRALHRGGHARVAAVFERSAYVALGEDLVCLGGDDLGCGPLNVIVAPRASVAGVLAHVGGARRIVAGEGTLRVDDTALDFRGAVRWEPPRIERACDAAVFAKRLAQWRAACAPRIPRDGLGFLLLGTQARGGGNALASRGRAAAAALREWLATVASRDGAASPGDIPGVLGNLIGLGPGLTPSGDDFLGGALIALHALGARALAQPLAARVLGWSKGRTHPVSVAHLRAAAEGYGSAALHACLVALAADRDASMAVPPSHASQGGTRSSHRDTAPCLDAIAATGHTSGWDALAGVVVAAEAIAPRRLASSPAPRRVS